MFLTREQYEIINNNRYLQLFYIACNLIPGVNENYFESLNISFPMNYNQSLALLMFWHLKTSIEEDSNVKFILLPEVLERNQDNDLLMIDYYFLYYSYQVTYDNLLNNIEGVPEKIIYKDEEINLREIIRSDLMKTMIKYISSVNEYYYYSSLFYQIAVLPSELDYLELENAELVDLQSIRNMDEQDLDELIEFLRDLPFDEIGNDEIEFIITEYQNPFEKAKHILQIIYENYNQNKDNLIELLEDKDYNYLKSLKNSGLNTLPINIQDGINYLFRNATIHLQTMANEWDILNEEEMMLTRQIELKEEYKIPKDVYAQRKYGAKSVEDFKKREIEAKEMEKAEEEEKRIAKRMEELEKPGLRYESGSEYEFEGGKKRRNTRKVDKKMIKTFSKSKYMKRKTGKKGNRRMKVSRRRSRKAGSPMPLNVIGGIHNRGDMHFGIKGMDGVIRPYKIFPDSPTGWRN